MIITQILNGLKRILLGSTYKFNIRKGSTSLNGASWVPIFTEMTETPVKLVSVTFLMENQVSGEYRIVVDGEKIFPFGDCSNIESGITRNFLIPVEVAAGSFLQIEVRSGINNKNVVILDEIAVIEVI